MKPTRKERVAARTVSQEGGSSRHWIRSRYQATALLCALLPCLLVAIVLGREYSTQRGKLATEPVKAEVSRQNRLAVEAEAAAIRARLKRLSFSSGALRDYAGMVLKAPQTFGASQGFTAPIIGKPAAPPAAAGSPPATTPPAKPAAPPSEAPAKAPLDNPIMYSQGKGGAIRKLFDDGGSAVFYRARTDNANFTVTERQKLFASAALDPLLKSAVKNEPLCVQSWILSSDGLLRTYPFRDFSAFDGTKDLTKLSIYAWSKDKADSAGIVWTSPYASPLSNQWVVACLASVSLGSRQVAVVGTELALAQLDKEALAFSLGDGAVSWLQRQDGVVLAAPAGGEEHLGVKALGSAALPSDDLPAKKLLEEANVLTGGTVEIGNALAGTEKTATIEAPVGDGKDGMFVYATPVGTADWTLGALVKSPLVASLYEYDRKLTLATQRRLLLLASICLISVALAIALALLESRRIVQPLRVLTMQLRQAADSPVPVSIADEGELGELAAALQVIVDRQHGLQIQPPAAPPEATLPFNDPEEDKGLPAG